MNNNPNQSACTKKPSSKDDDNNSTLAADERYHRVSDHNGQVSAGGVPVSLPPHSYQAPTALAAHEECNWVSHVSHQVVYYDEFTYVPPPLPVVFLHPRPTLTPSTSISEEHFYNDLYSAEYPHDMSFIVPPPQIPRHMYDYEWYDYEYDFEYPSQQQEQEQQLPQQENFSNHCPDGAYVHNGTIFFTQPEDNINKQTAATTSQEPQVMDGVSTDNTITSADLPITPTTNHGFTDIGAPTPGLLGTNSNPSTAFCLPHPNMHVPLSPMPISSETSVMGNCGAYYPAACGSVSICTNCRSMCDTTLHSLETSHSSCRRRRTRRRRRRRRTRCQRRRLHVHDAPEIETEVRVRATEVISPEEDTSTPHSGSE